MDTYVNTVVSYLFAQSWQIALLVGIVGLISHALRNQSAHIRHILWLIVLAKCLIPPFLTVPLAVLPERDISPSGAGISQPEVYSVPENPASGGNDQQPQALKPSSPANRKLMAFVWIVGASLFGGWIGSRAVRYTTWLRKRRRPLPPAVLESIRDLSAGFQFKHWPRIWLLEDINQPFVWGMVRGSVYLPTNFLSLSDSNQQRSILAHEFSHIARFDAGVNLLQVVAQAVYWFHPFVWWFNRKIRQEREKCCDEMAIVYLNTLPDCYTDAIVNVLAAERRSSHPIPSLAVVSSVKDIEERIQTMLRPGKKFYNRPSLVSATVVLLVAFLIIPSTVVLTTRGGEQTTIQSMASEKPESPRFAARTFNSKVAFDVLVQETSSFETERQIGHTPSDTPVEIPACWIWRVKPLAPVNDWDLLIRELSQNEVPGLKLEMVDFKLKQLAGLVKLKSLLVGGGQIPDADLEYLKGMPQLEELILFGTMTTDAGTVHLKGLANLRTLMLGATEITDVGLENLKAMTGLKSFILLNTKTTNTGLRHLKDMTGLQTLGLQYIPITDAGLGYLSGLTKLRHLDLSGTSITDAGLEYLKSLSLIEGLNLGGTQITDAGLEHLKGMTGMDKLSLRDTKITGTGLEHLKGMTGLKSLDLVNTKITDAGMEPLKNFSKLEVLYLYRTMITDVGVNHLKGITSLKTLLLNGTKVTDTGVEHLKNLFQIKELGLDRTQITDVGLEHLKNLSQIEDLTLGGTVISDAGLVHVKGITSLKTLLLANTKITDLGLEYLKGLNRLKRIYLQGTPITDAGLIHLKGLTGLQFLNLEGTQVTDAGVQQLKQSLPGLNIYRGQTK